ncbi:MAG: NYN domain-containing protein [Acidobacteria bacterium]|nr:NYN domain-containing protein [Acidobacteriota bacterium]
MHNSLVPIDGAGGRSIWPPFSVLTPPRRRTIVYIDGFNLYYGAIKGGPHKWLNLELLCSRLRTDDDLVRVNYFTSLVDGTRGARQRVFLDALSTLPKVVIILGQFKRKTVTCLNTRCTLIGDRTFQMPEEKRTDVGIGVQMLDDAYQDGCNTFVLISGDSDLVPAVQRIRQRFSEKKVIAYRPVGEVSLKARRADELAQAAGGGRLLPRGLFAHCHFPDVVVGARGAVVVKPAGW